MDGLVIMSALDLTKDQERLFRRIGIVLMFGAAATTFLSVTLLVIEHL